MHGPAWVAKPTEAEEREVVDAIVDTVKKADKSIAFLRIDTWFADGTEKVLSTVPYDQTVVIDITGGDDEILARMKRRGRVTCASLCASARPRLPMRRIRP